MIGFGLISGFLLKKGLGINMQKIIGIGLIVVLIAGMAWRIRAAGVRAGKATARLEEVEKQLGDQATEQAKLASTIKEQEAAIASAKEREAEHVEERQEWARMVEESSRALASLQAQSRAITQQVSRISDSDLAFNIKKALAMRHPDAYGIPGYAPLEERAILQCVLDYPICEKKREEMAEQITGMQGELVAFGKQVQEIHLQVNGLTAMLEAHRLYERQLEGHYEGAVNALRRPRRKWWCGFLCKRKKTLTLPSLDELLQKKPGTP